MQSNLRENNRSGAFMLSVACGVLLLTAGMVAVIVTTL